MAVDAPSDPVDELSAHDGEFCPQTLPQAPRETYGFGTSTRASDSPSLWEPQEAWICTYGAKDVAPSGSNGAWYEWARKGSPRQLSADELAGFAEAITQLKPSEDEESLCTDDLGPRYLVSFAYDNDLTGVVIDDYGCGEVRLTDDPFVTVSGDASQPGTVSGVLVQPAGMLSDLNVG